MEQRVHGTDIFFAANKTSKQGKRTSLNSMKKIYPTTGEKGQKEQGTRGKKELHRGVGRAKTRGRKPSTRFERIFE